MDVKVRVVAVYIVKRITHNERQSLPGGGLRNPRFIGVDDVSEGNAVSVLGARFGYADQIARFEFTQSAKKVIAVSG